MFILIKIIKINFKKMDTVKVKKSDLLAVLKENRKKHKEEYKESIRAYRLKAADLLSKELAKITAGKKFNTYFDLEKPTSHEKDYDLTIKMIEMSIDEVFELRTSEFNQLVLDEWSWRSSFDSARYSNSGYQGYCGTSGVSGTTGLSGTAGYSRTVKFSSPGIYFTELDEPRVDNGAVGKIEDNLPSLTVTFSDDEM
jgi:hypothetical protein